MQRCYSTRLTDGNKLKFHAKKKQQNMSMLCEFSNPNTQTPSYVMRCAYLYLYSQVTKLYLYNVV